MQISMTEWRQHVAKLEAPGAKFGDTDIERMHEVGIRLIKALRAVYGKGLDRLSLWERISKGILSAGTKSQGKGGTFLSGLLDYVQADINKAVANPLLLEAYEDIKAMTAEEKRLFIRTCMADRRFLCLEARDDIEAEHEDLSELRLQLGKEFVARGKDGEIVGFDTYAELKRWRKNHE